MILLFILNNNSKLILNALFSLKTLNSDFVEYWPRDHEFDHNIFLSIFFAIVRKFTRIEMVWVSKLWKREIVVEYSEGRIGSSAIDDGLNGDEALTRAYRDSASGPGESFL